MRVGGLAVLGLVWLHLVWFGLVMIFLYFRKYANQWVSACWRVSCAWFGLVAFGLVWFSYYLSLFQEICQPVGECVLAG